MSAGCMRWVLSHAVRGVCVGNRGYWTPAPRLTICSGRCNTGASSWRQSPFCTAVDNTEQAPVQKKEKKQKKDPRARDTITTVGHRIPQPHIQVISDTGENLGVMHRANVIRIMDKEGLKLVLLSEYQDPPVYKLMSGKQIHEEQMKLWEKQKGKAAPVQMKELTLSVGIGAHDITVKLKKVESWLEKKHHVRLTLRPPRRQLAVDLDSTLEQIVQQLEVEVGFASKPSLIREGREAMCILRPPSAKELARKGKNTTADPKPKATPSETSPVSNTDTAEGPIQQ